MVFILNTIYDSLKSNLNSVCFLLKLMGFWIDFFFLFNLKITVSEVKSSIVTLIVFLEDFKNRFSERYQFRKYIDDLNYLFYTCIMPLVPCYFMIVSCR